MDIICIGHIKSYIDCNICHALHSFVLVMDIICIGHITSYLARNISHILHMYSSSVYDWCAITFPVCNLIYFSFLSYFRLVYFVSEYELNPNLIRIYVTSFLT